MTQIRRAESADPGEKPHQVTVDVTDEPHSSGDGRKKSINVIEGFNDSPAGQDHQPAPFIKPVVPSFSYGQVKRPVMNFMGSRKYATDKPGTTHSGDQHGQDGTRAVESTCSIGAQRSDGARENFYGNSAYYPTNEGISDQSKSHHSDESSGHITTIREPIELPNKLFDAIDVIASNDDDRVLANDLQEHSSTLDSMLANVARVWKDRQQMVMRDYDEEREIWKAELLRTLTEKGELQDRLDLVARQNRHLTTVVAEQRSKLDSYSVRVVKCKKFMDGLGKDLDALKDDANRRRKQIDELINDILAQRETQTFLHQELVTCSKRAVGIKGAALRNYQEISKDFEVSQERLKYLEQSLHEKTGLLAEERDQRARLSIDQSATKVLSEVITSSLERHNEVLIGELRKMQEKADGDERDSSMKEDLQETIAALRNAESKQEATNESIAALQQALEDRLASVATQVTDHHSNRTTQESTKDWLLPYLEKTSAAFQQKVLEETNRFREESDRRESIADLRRKLEASEINVTHVSEELSMRRSKEDDLEKQNAALQAKVRQLQDQVISPRLEPARFEEMKADLIHKEDLLGQVRSELAQKVQEIILQTTLNTNLEERINELQNRLEEMSSTLPILEQEQKRLKQEHCTEIDRVRSNMSEQARRFHEEQKCKVDNELKRAMAERDDAIVQIRQLKDTLKMNESSPQDTRDSSSQCEDHNNSEANILQLENKILEERIAVLNTTIKDLRTELSEENTTSLQHSEQQAELERVTAQKDVLQRQLEHFEATAADVQLNKDQTITDLDWRRKEHNQEHNQEIIELQEKLKDAQEKIERLQTADEGTESKRDVTQLKGQKKVCKTIDALQLRLAEAEASLHRKQQADIGFRSQVERSWQMERENHRLEVANLKDMVSVSKQHASEMKAENKQLRRALVAFESKDDQPPGNNNQQPRLTVVPNTPKHVEGQLLPSIPVTGMLQTAPQRKHDEGSMDNKVGSPAETEDVVIRDSQRSSQQSPVGDSTILSVMNEIADFVHDADVEKSDTGVWRPEVAGKHHESSLSGEDPSGINSKKHGKVAAKVRPESRSSQSWGQESRKRYSQMDMPRPNSSSKRVRPENAVSQTPQKSNAHTQEAMGRHPRSPFQIADPSQDDNVTTQQQPTRTPDPRLTAKRKTGDKVESDQGQRKRKRRDGAGSTTHTELAPKHGLKSAQPSIPSTPSAFTSGPGGYSLRRRSGSNARMQTFISKSTRQRRGSRRVSKHDQMDDRFSQELAER